MILKGNGAVRICGQIYFFGVFAFFSINSANGQARVVDTSIGSDPISMKSRFTTDFEAYYFISSARFYALRPGYDYGLSNGKHLFGMSLPLVHNIFNADFGGFENTSGIGDLKMRYVLVPFEQSSKAGLQRVSTYVEVTAPTGEYKLGRGTGSWQYKPGLVLSFKPNPFVAFYPEVKLQISGGDANNQGAGDGAPDPNDPDKDGKTQNLSFSVPAVVLVNSWNGWISLNAMYIRSFAESVDFLFLRTDIGIMIGENTSASLNLSKFIAGEPRLSGMAQVRLQYFIP